MNREIKFRAWYKEPGEPGKMIEVTELRCSPNVEDWIVNDLPTQKYIKSLMQYTGLKDKNGKEIYEGDILAAKFKSSFIERVYWSGPPDAICEVRWDYAGFRLTAHGEQDKRYVDFWDFTDPYAANDLVMMENTETEVIGNIYQNPELLEDRS